MSIPTEIPASLEPDPLLGSMRDFADELDIIVADAMRHRRASAWLPNAEDFAALEAISEETGRPMHELLDEALKLLLHKFGNR